MAQGKQTPRQKMINLMYLVFIAMLALNIDQEIIRSYYDSTQSLFTTRQQTETKNIDIFESTLKAKSETVPETFLKPYKEYDVLKTKIDDLVKYADEVKNTLKKGSEFKEGINPDTKKPWDVSENFSALNNNEASTKFFFVDGEESKPSQNAKILQSKIDDVRNYIKQTFGADQQMKSLVERAESSLITAFPEGKRDNKDWLQYKFYHQPLIAAVSNLEILQNDARNIQADALTAMLKEKVDANIKFNQYEAIVSAPTDVISGAKADATVVLASYSNSNKIQINGVDRVENGKGFKSLSTAGSGPQTFSGSISLQTADGKTTSIPFTHTYNVIAGPQIVKYQTAVALLTADKMNVMYRGLPNPVSGSIVNVDINAVNLSASGAAVSKTGAGHWTVTPTSGNTVNLTISGPGPKGTVSQNFTYRIKPVPPPQSQIRGKMVVQMPASSIPNQIVECAMPDFDFPVSFQVNSFLFKAPGRAAIPVSGNSLSAVAGAVKNLKSGDVCYIMDVKATATGLGGQQLRNSNVVVIQVN